MTRRAWTLALVMLAVLLVALPLAEAKGGYGGGRGRRSCHPTDTNGDGVVSEEERQDQCSDWDWVELGFFGVTLALVGGAAVAKAVGKGAGRRAGLTVGGELLVAGYKARVVGKLRYRGGGDTWDEWCLLLNGRRFWLEDDEGKLTLHRHWSVPATIDPPTAEGKPIRVVEQGQMRLVSNKGVPGDEAGGTFYVDGTLPNGRRVSLDSEGGRVEAFLCTGARFRDGRLALDDPGFIG